jgi:hypothetical protein
MKAFLYITIIILIFTTGCAPTRLPPISAAPAQITPTLPSIPTQTPLQPNTAVPSPIFTPSATADPRLPPEDWMNWPVVPETTKRVYEIYQHGIELGNNPQHFSKIGDCHNVKEAFMGLFDKPGWYKLRNENAHLQPVIDWFSGSFDRDGYAVQGGFNAAAVLNPTWADQEFCEPDESPVACEIRIHQPSFAIVSLELAWLGRTPERYEDYLRQVLDLLIAQGVVPILATKADNVEGDHAINYTTAKLAYEYDLPLWNFWRAAQDLPNHGMDPMRNDGFHISYEAWTERSFTALRTLDVIWGSVR